jgi:inactivated superfamily I helicase
VPAAAAVETLVGRLVEARVIMPASPDMVEILGWLDLALDDSSAMVVVGMNHPFVPESVTADPFLPGGLRTRLKVADNDRRFARDAYALAIDPRNASRYPLDRGRRGVDGSPRHRVACWRHARPKTQHGASSNCSMNRRRFPRWPIAGRERRKRPTSRFRQPIRNRRQDVKRHGVS